MIQSFDIIVKENLILYFILFILITLIYIFIIRKQIFSIFDPLLFFALESSGAFATIVILKENYLINDKFFYSFILSEMAFIIGLVIVKKRKKQIDIHNYCNYSNRRNILFFLASITYFFVQMKFYYSYGIPILRNTTEISLLDLEEKSGILKKILNSLMPIIILCSIDFFVKQNKKNIISKMMYISMSIFLIISLLLSGWKSNILVVIFLFSIYMFFMYGENNKYNINNLKINKMNKKISVLLILAIISALVIINYTYVQNSVDSPGFYLLKRFFLSGDIFIYSYTDSLLFQSIEKGNFFCNIIASTFIGKIINFYFPKSIVMALGVQVYQLATGNVFITGPNPRHNFTGLIYFGVFGGIIYSFIIGLVTSFIRNYLYNKGERSLYKFIISCTVIYYITYAHVDLSSLCFTQIYYFIIVSIPLFIFTEVINKICIHNSLYYKNILIRKL